MEFKEGQVWKDREGDEITLASVNEKKPYPLKDTNERRYMSDGKWLEDNEYKYDLVELVKDVEELNLSNPSSEDTSQPADTLSGLSASYYDLPFSATQIQDLIEYKEMNFSQGNILKAIYRLGSKSSVDAKYDLEKIIYFAQRELKRIQK